MHCHRNATVMLVMCGYTCERLFGYRNALVERVSIERSKAKTKKDARLELEMTRPGDEAGYGCGFNQTTELSDLSPFVPAHRAQLCTRRGRRRRVWALKSSSLTPGGTGPNPGRPALAAATLEAANGMTSHSKTCYADIVKCLARRWPQDAEFSNTSGDFANAHDGRRSIHKSCSTSSCNF